MLDQITQWPTCYNDAPIFQHPWKWSKLGDSMRLIDTSSGMIYTRDNWLISRTTKQQQQRSDKR